MGLRAHQPGNRRRRLGQLLVGLVATLRHGMADAVAEGLLERSGKAAKAEGEAEQPMAAWEKELLTEGAPAAEAPAEAEGETKAE